MVQQIIVGLTILGVIYCTIRLFGAMLHPKDWNNIQNQIKKDHE